MTKRTPTADPGASNAPSTDDVLSSCETAAFLKTTESQLATMRYQGRGPSFVRTPGGRTIKILADRPHRLAGGRRGSARQQPTVPRMSAGPNVSQDDRSRLEDRLPDPDEWLPDPVLRHVEESQQAPRGGDGVLRSVPPACCSVTELTVIPAKTAATHRLSATAARTGPGDR